MVKDLQLHFCLLMKSRLVSDDLDSTLTQFAVVINFQHLTEGTFAKYAQNLKAVCEVVSDNGLVVATVIIKSLVVLSCIVHLALN